MSKPVIRNGEVIGKRRPFLCEVCGFLCPVPDCMCHFFTQRGIQKHIRTYHPWYQPTVSTGAGARPGVTVNPYYGVGDGHAPIGSGYSPGFYGPGGPGGVGPGGPGF